MEPILKKERSAIDAIGIFQAEPNLTTRLLAPRSPDRIALKDVVDGLKQWRVWLLLAWLDIKLRYRRSILGPLWITLSMAITIYTMGLLYSRLFKFDLSDYYPFLATGFLGWSLLSSILIESPSILLEAEQFIKQMKQPYSVFIFRSVTRSFIIFFHNFLVLIPIIFFFKVKVNLYTLVGFLSIILLWINGVAYGTILTLLGTRFRDIVPLTASLVQIVFFLTPILWSPALLPQRYAYVVKLNPFAQFMEIIRNPLTGFAPSAYGCFIVISFTLIGLWLAFFLFSRYRSSIPYWL